MSNLYPLFADLLGRRVVVIGGGSVAQRKVITLLDCGAHVLVIAPQLTDKLNDLHKQNLIEAHNRPYHPGDLADAWLVLAATGSEKVNREIFDEAHELHVFCNVVDVPNLCTFQVPALMTRGNLQIAISTGGASPALAGRIRRQLQEHFGPYYETFLEALQDLRNSVKEKYPDDQPRRAKILQSFVDSDALELLRENKTDEFDKLLADWKNL